MDATVSIEVLHNALADAMSAPTGELSANELRERRRSAADLHARLRGLGYIVAPFSLTDLPDGVAAAGIKAAQEEGHPDMADRIAAAYVTILATMADRIASA